MPPEALCLTCGKTFHSEERTGLSALIGRHNLGNRECDEFEIYTSCKEVGDVAEDSRFLGTAFYKRGNQTFFENPSSITLEF